MAPSPLQILVIVLIIVLLFGASRLGDIGKGLGEGIRNFKKGISGDSKAEDEDEDEDDEDDEEPPKQLTAGKSNTVKNKKKRRPAES